MRDATFKVTIINLFDHETVTCQLGFTTSKSILLNKAPFPLNKTYFLNHLTPSLPQNYLIISITLSIQCIPYGMDCANNGTWSQFLHFSS